MTPRPPVSCVIIPPPYPPRTGGTGVHGIRSHSALLTGDTGDTGGIRDTGTAIAGGGRAPEAHGLAFTFEVPGRPVSWQRPKETRRHRHTDTKQRIGQRRIRIAARNALPEDWSREGDFRLEVECYFKRRPLNDADNLLKAVMDSLQRSGSEVGVVFDDDRQVVEARVRKYFEAELERTVVRVERLT